MSGMNGFSMFAEQYRKMAAEGKISQEEADRYCRNFDYLATCNEDDFNTLFEGQCFNEIAKGYLQIAVSELVGEGKISKDQGSEVRSRFAELLGDVSPKEARKAVSQRL